MAPGLVCTLACALALTACGDDEASASGGEGETEGTGDDDDDNDSVDDTSGDDDDDNDSVDDGAECSSDADCTSDDPCLAGVCSDGTCSMEPVLSTQCRPVIDIEFPPRGATIEGEVGEPVTVVGTVQTGLGTIESFTLDGEPIDFDPDDGTFGIDIDPVVGGNTLVFETEDSNGWTRRRVQSFLWSTSFMLPTEPMEGPAPQGIMLFLGQESLDDGDPSKPINDLAAVFQLALDNLDVGSFVDPKSPIASEAGYDIYVTSLTKGAATATLTGIDGGMHLDASLDDIQGDLDFDCGQFLCELAGGDGTGGLSMSSVDISADILISVDDENALQVDLANVATTVNNLDIWSNNGWTNFLLGLLEGLILDGVVSDVEALLADEVQNTLGPLLVDGLGGFSLSAPIDFPSLADPDAGITVNLETDVGATDWHDGVAPPRRSPAQGGLIDFRGGGYVEERLTSYDNDGIPYRADCAHGSGVLDIPRSGALEIGLTDDLINQLLYGAWAGGLLEFELGLGGDDEGGTGGDGGGGPGGIEIEGVEISGMLAPTATDCNPDGLLYAHVGDMQITATIIIMEQQIDFVAYSSLALELEIGASEDGVTIDIPGLAWIESELTVMQDEAIDQEESLTALLNSLVETQLISGLSGGFGGISLPELDVSALAGLPEGSATLSIQVDEVERLPGVTVMRGHF